MIGGGINVCNSVPATGSTWQKLTIHKQDSHTALLSKVAAAVLLGIWRGIFYRNSIDSPTFIDAYQSLLTHLNKPVVLEGKTWKVVGVTESGYLTLESTSEDLALTNGPVAQLIHVKSGELSLGYAQSG